MKWILFFLLLAALLTTTTHAAPTSPTGPTTDDSPMVPQNDSPTIPEDASPTILEDNSLTTLTGGSRRVAPKCTNKSPTGSKEDLISYLLPRELLFEIYSTLPDEAKAGLKLASGKTLKEAVDPFDLMLESPFMENLIGLNQEFQLEEQIIHILVRDHHVREIDARQAVENAREMKRDHSHQEILAEELNPHPELLVQMLEPIFPPMSYWKRLEVVNSIYLEALKDIGVVQQKFMLEPEFVNDDRIMDLTFPLMLIGKKEPRLLSEDPIQFEKNIYRVIAKVEKKQLYWWELPASEFQNLVNQKMQLDGSVNYNAYKVWKILQQARQMIKQANKTQPNRNVDETMIELLVPLLHATKVEAEIAADENEIRETMEQTRNAITLRNAVVFKKARVLRNLVASSISLPVFVFGEIARQDILNILHRHPSFQAVGISELLDKISCRQGRHPILKHLFSLDDIQSLLRKVFSDPCTTHATLAKILVMARESGPTSIQAFIFKEIFQHKGRVRILRILGEDESPQAKLFTTLYAMELRSDSSVWMDPRWDPSIIQHFEDAVKAAEEYDKLRKDQMSLNYIAEDRSI